MAALHADQIRRHLQGIVNKFGGTVRDGKTILVGLTKEPIADSERNMLTAEANQHGIRFAAVTFTQILEAFRAQCASHEQELISIVEDYESYLAEEGLLEERNQWLVVFPCGTSLTENASLGLYWEPPNRPCKRNYRFIGVYTRKTIRYVGNVEAIAIASYGDGSPSFVEEAGHLTDDHKARIKSAIEQISYYDLRTSPLRHYAVSSFVPTEARKTSPGGIMGLRYLDLSKMIARYDPRRDYTAEELAKALRGTTWE